MLLTNGVKLYKECRTFPLNTEGNQWDLEKLEDSCWLPVWLQYTQIILHTVGGKGFTSKVMYNGYIFKRERRVFIITTL